MAGALLNLTHGCCELLTRCVPVHASRVRAMRVAKAVDALLFIGLITFAVLGGIGTVPMQPSAIHCLSVAAGWILFLYLAALNREEI